MRRSQTSSKAFDGGRKLRIFRDSQGLRRGIRIDGRTGQLEKGRRGRTAHLSGSIILALKKKREKVGERAAGKRSPNQKDAMSSSANLLSQPIRAKGRDAYSRWETVLATHQIFAQVGGVERKRQSDPSLVNLLDHPILGSKNVYPVVGEIESNTVYESKDARTNEKGRKGMCSLALRVSQKLGNSTEEACFTSKQTSVLPKKIGVLSSEDKKKQLSSLVKRIEISPRKT